MARLRGVAARGHCGLPLSAPLEVSLDVDQVEQSNARKCFESGELAAAFKSANPFRRHACAPRYLSNRKENDRLASSHATLLACTTWLTVQNPAAREPQNR
jgi:hypothetical protein